MFVTLIFWIKYHIYIGPFLQGHKPTHVFKTRIVGADLLGASGMYIIDNIGYYIIFLFAFFVCEFASLQKLISILQY